MSSMRHDLKLKRLFAKYGLEGYGLYNFILESITESLTTDNPNPDLQESCADIAQFYNGDTTRINEIACFMINQGLLEIDEITQRITCKKIYKFLEQSQTRSEKIRELIAQYKNYVSDSLGQSQTFMIEKNKKRIRKEKEIEKHTYFNFSNVLLKEDEYNSLISKYGNTNTQRFIEKLHYYKEAHGKKYKSDYAAINQWVIEAVGRDKNVVSEVKKYDKLKDQSDKYLEEIARARDEKAKELKNK